ncbi:ATP-grasp domain-containing protein [Actinoplanes sp. NPDC051494]|uniref:ATP-grasp domain-containing protein n=1 Tax=Actinoplanes sp. NPDC051494 TaxID=3363907 RepID=UPI00378763A3
MNLILPPRLTTSAEKVRDAARRRGLDTVQLPTFEVPDGLRGDHLHCGPEFADAVGPTLGIAELEAPRGWLAELPRVFVGRDVQLVTLGEAQQLRRPAFVKSPNDKSVRAMVYTDGSRLPGSDAFDPGTEVLVSDIVDFGTEVRLFVLDGAVHASGQYASEGRLDLATAGADALAFAADLLDAQAHTLPSAIVIDIGTVDGRWAVIEANAAWASGIYLAPADDVLDVCLRAARPKADVPARDRPFIRPGA